ncbi:hypothetical protein POTOM_010014 [Populus tomentosa]|uniref:Transducin/WD40 repeat-like superfamily protein n=1 Tax=Populus tomentosa TaxID=118781 RepID=A0A8X8AH46_POPTO|nr:hypothetical protein POTOM_010014 [Populus tomentosa]
MRARTLRETFVHIERGQSIMLQILQVNIWSYTGRKLLRSIDTGHSANIFCSKFVPETSDELVVSGAGDAKVEVGNPNVVWSASEDGTLRQHDFREGASCPPGGSYPHECRNILLDLQSGAKRSLTDPPKQALALKSCNVCTSRPYLLLVGGSDAFARLYDRRMLPPLTSHRKRMNLPPCANYFFPMHLSEHVTELGSSSLHLTHVTFSPNGDEVLLSYSGEHVYLMNVNYSKLHRLCLYYEVSGVDFEVKTILVSDMIYNLIDGGRDLSGGIAVRYTMGDASKLMTISPTLNGLELQPLSSRASFLGQRGCCILVCWKIRNSEDLRCLWNEVVIVFMMLIDGISVAPGQVICLVSINVIVTRGMPYVLGDYVAGGSDDGRWFIWEKRTCRLIKMLLGDEAVVNCVHCHPFDCVVATSGIDSTIKIWTPSASVPSIVAGGAAGPEINKVLLYNFISEFVDAALAHNTAQFNKVSSVLSIQGWPYLLAAEVQVEPFFSSKNIRAKVSAT